MDEYSVKLDDESEMYCSLYLFTNVTNADEIRKNVVSGKFRCSILKAALIVDPFQVLIAANKAALNATLNRLTTKSIYTEILFCLSMSKNISRALVEFGIDNNDKNVVVVLIHSEKNSVPKEIFNYIKGEQIPIHKLPDYTDQENVRKIYNIEKEELAVSSIVDSVISRISIKDFASLK